MATDRENFDSELRAHERIVKESVKQRSKLRKLSMKINSGYIPCYVSEDGPWYVKFNGIDPSWNLLAEYSQVNFNFYNFNKVMGVFPKEIAWLIIEWLDFRRSTRIAARISLKSDCRRLPNVLARADRLYPEEYDLLLWVHGPND